MPEDSFIDTAMTAARRAGALLREYYRKERVIDHEEHHDVKLHVDRLAEKEIVAVLRDRHADHTIITEESPVMNGGQRHAWIIDPLDGTVNFAHAVPHFCTSIALCEDGRLVCGVIYNPMLDEMFTAVAGKGARLNGEPIRVSSRAELAECIAAGGFAKSVASIDEGKGYFVEMVRRLRKMRITGSAALDMAYVACGRFDAYLERHIYLWDVAAGTLLIREAGGAVNAMPSPNGADTLVTIGTNGLIHAALVALNDMHPEGSEQIL